ncbi:hypothetical protein ACERK3_04095 [Phycisphaerales bacterium AB-hyl4]|uniref:Tetratricopeptide repeat protein n=1 Tax=Natronomicrosphaera hydrolytica TaxID=3242702 RepID=A0ABV4U1J3_9BACT
MPRHLHLTNSFTWLAILSLTIALGHTRAMADNAERDADALMADQFVMMMYSALASDESPRPDQLRQAQILIDQALALREDEAELWRLRAELADRMEDRDAYRAAMRQYIRLEPTDDVAQLERLLEGLGEQQTLDERLARLEAILQASSTQRLSAPLRSRLATHAALAAHELGDDDRLRRWLDEALGLDSANADAAELAYARTQRNDSSPAERGDALINMVKASPADPMARLRLARWLTTQAVYDTAAQQFDTAAILVGGPLPIDVYAHWVIALAASGDADSARQLLNQLAPTQQNANDADDQQPRGIDPEAYPDIRLSLEILRLAMLGDQPEPAERSFARIRRLINSSFDQDELPDWLDGPDAPAPDIGRNVMLAWTAAVFNQQLDELPDLLAELPEDEPLVRRARGWMHLQRDEPDEAAEQLELIADDDPLAALGLTCLLDVGSSEHTQALQAVLHRDGGGLAGLLAARQLLANDQAVPRTRAGRSIDNDIDRGPLQLWRPALNTSPWTSMYLRVSPESVDYLQPLYATIELRNTSRMSMPVRTGRGVPERALLSPAPSAGGQPLARPQPIIVDVRRRLTLEPGETMRITVRLDRSQLGQFMQANPARTLAINVLGVLGPRPTRTGGVTAEPVGSVDSVRAITARGTPINEERINQWLEELDSEQPVTRMRALARLLRSIDHLPDELDTRAVRRRIAEPINEQFAEWDTMQQAWAVRMLTRSDRSRDLFRRILDAAERSDDSIVRLTFMATHLDGSASSALNAALRHDDTTIRTFAEALRDAADARDEDEDEQNNAS